MNLPKKLSGDSEFAAEWNKMVGALAETPIGFEQEGSFQSPHGTVRRIARGLKARLGLRFADPKTYQFQNSYSPNEVVIVLPESLAVTDGIPSEDTDANQFALAGMWVCLQAVDPINHGTEEAPDMAYRVPQWPAPEPDDPDHESNYWWPISFYPVLKTDCGTTGQIKTWYNGSEKLPIP